MINYFIFYRQKKNSLIKKIQGHPHEKEELT